MKKGNLLIVDDEEKLLKRLKFNLEDLSDKTFTADNGLEALEIIKKNEIHCIVCDINMPKMNGVEVIKSIRAQGNKVPFIFYTAHGNEELMLEAVKYGAFDFLNKPSIEGLEAVVANALKEGLNGADAKISLEAHVSNFKKLLDNKKK